MRRSEAFAQLDGEDAVGIIAAMPQDRKQNPIVVEVKDLDRKTARKRSSRSTSSASSASLTPDAAPVSDPRALEAAEHQLKALLAFLEDEDRAAQHPFGSRTPLPVFRDMIQVLREPSDPLSDLDAIIQRECNRPNINPAVARDIIADRDRLLNIVRVLARRQLARMESEAAEPVESRT